MWERRREAKYHETGQKLYLEAAGDGLGEFDKEWPLSEARNLNPSSDQNDMLFLQQDYFTRTLVPYQDFRRWRRKSAAGPAMNVNYNSGYSTPLIDKRVPMSRLSSTRRKRYRKRYSHVGPSLISASHWRIGDLTPTQAGSKSEACRHISFSCPCQHVWSSPIYIIPF